MGQELLKMMNPETKLEKLFLNSVMGIVMIATGIVIVATLGAYTSLSWQLSFARWRAIRRHRKLDEIFGETWRN